MTNSKINNLVVIRSALKNIESRLHNENGQEIKLRRISDLIDEVNDAILKC